MNKETNEILTNALEAEELSKKSEEEILEEELSNWIESDYIMDYNNCISLLCLMNYRFLESYDIIQGIHEISIETNIKDQVMILKFNTKGYFQRMFHTTVISYDHYVSTIIQASIMANQFSHIISHDGSRVYKLDRK